MISGWSRSGLIPLRAYPAGDRWPSRVRVGPGVGRVLLFSITAAFNPTLLAATTVMLLLPKPKRLLLGYLCGALFTSITLAW